MVTTHGVLLQQEVCHQSLPGISLLATVEICPPLVATRLLASPWVLVLYRWGPWAGLSMVTGSYLRDAGAVFPYLWYGDVSPGLGISA